MCREKPIELLVDPDGGCVRKRSRKSLSTLTAGELVLLLVNLLGEQLIIEFSFAR